MVVNVIAFGDAKKTTLICDSGAAVSVVHSKLLDGVEHSVKCIPSRKFVTANGKPIGMKLFATFEVMVVGIGKRIRLQDVLIMDSEEASQNHIIMGGADLVKAGILLDFSRGLIKFEVGAKIVAPMSRTPMTHILQIKKAAETSSKPQRYSTIVARIEQSGKDVASSNAIPRDPKSRKFEQVAAGNENVKQSVANHQKYPNQHSMGRVKYASYKDAVGKRAKVAELADGIVFGARQNKVGGIAAQIRRDGKVVAGSNAVIRDQESRKFENVVAYNKNTSRSTAARKTYQYRYNMDRVGHASHKDAVGKRDNIVKRANEKALEAEQKVVSTIEAQIRKNGKNVVSHNVAVRDQRGRKFENVVVNNTNTIQSAATHNGCPNRYNMDRKRYASHKDAVWRHKTVKEKILKAKLKGDRAIAARIKEDGRGVAGSNAAIRDPEGGVFEKVVENNTSTSKSVATQNSYSNRYNMDRGRRALHKDAVWRSDEIVKMANEKVLRTKPMRDSAIGARITESGKNVAGGNTALTDLAGEEFETVVANNKNGSQSSVTRIQNPSRYNRGRASHASPKDAAGNSNKGLARNTFQRIYAEIGNDKSDHEDEKSDCELNACSTCQVAKTPRTSTTMFVKAVHDCCRGQKVNWKVHKESRSTKGTKDKDRGPENFVGDYEVFGELQIAIKKADTDLREAIRLGKLKKLPSLITQKSEWRLSNTVNSKITYVKSEILMYEKWSLGTMDQIVAKIRPFLAVLTEQQKRRRKTLKSISELWEIEKQQGCYPAEREKEANSTVMIDDSGILSPENWSRSLDEMVRFELGNVISEQKVFPVLLTKLQGDNVPEILDSDRVIIGMTSALSMEVTLNATGDTIIGKHLSELRKGDLNDTLEKVQDAACNNGIVPYNNNNMDPTRRSKRQTAEPKRLEIQTVMKITVTIRMLKHL